jgi:hypothetical protein
MKRFALLVLVVLALASPAMAGLGTLGLFADNQGNSCNITDVGGFLSIYLLHVMKPGDESTATRFAIGPPAGWTYVTYSTTFVGFGDAMSDLSVGYGGCQPSTIIVAQFFFTSTVAAPCSYVNVLPNGITNNVLGLDCNFAEIEMPKSGQAIVNPNAGCQCDVAVQPTTWGQVKALYR